MTTVQPIHDNVLVKPHATEDEEALTSGGIVLPFESKSRVVGTVIAVGRGCVNTKTGKIKPVSVAPDDKVLIGTKTGEKVVKGGVEYKLLPEDQIMGVLADELFESMT